MKIIDPYRFRFTGLSWEFDGINEYINIGEPVSLNYITGSAVDWSMEFWFKLDGAGTQRALMGRGDTIGAEQNRGVFVYIGILGKLTLIIRNSVGTTNIFQSIAALTTGVWYHVVVVRDYGVTIKGYINAVADGSVADTVGTFTFTAVRSWGIGVFRLDSILGPNSEYAGVQSIVTIYNKALSLAEVITNYNGGIPTDTRLGSLSANITSMWTGADTSDGPGGVEDVGGNNSNDGTLTNMTVAVNVVNEFPS